MAQVVTQMSSSIAQDDAQPLKNLPARGFGRGMLLFLFRFAKTETPPDKNGARRVFAFRWMVGPVKKGLR